VSSSTTSQSQQQPQPQPPRTLRNKRSSILFNKRRSGFFHVNEDGMLDVVAEDPSLEQHQAKRVKDKDIPELPEIQALQGEHSHEIGWDDGMFKKSE
jgi:hypothetical protein